MARALPLLPALLPSLLAASARPTAGALERVLGASLAAPAGTTP